MCGELQLGRDLPAEINTQRAGLGVNSVLRTFPREALRGALGFTSLTILECYLLSRVRLFVTP